MDDGGISASSIVLFVVLLFVEAILTGFNKAISLMNVKEIEQKAQNDKDKKSILLNSIAIRSTIYVNSIQMIITFVELIMGCVYIPKGTTAAYSYLVQFNVFSGLGESILNVLSLSITIVIIMYMILTLGILLPKKLAQQYPDKWAYTFIHLIHFLRTVLYPLTGIVAVSANTLLSILGLRNVDEQPDVTEEEIISMVNEGHEQGVLEADEVEMINNIFEFGDKEANKIMTHRNNIMAIDSEMPFKEALTFMLNQGNSRYPVYKETLDHIVGVLYLKDAMRIHTLNEKLNNPVGRVRGLLRDAVYVPETKKIDDLFKSMQSQQNQMVIVMDEYGQTAGLVTMEDILEEIVGNIMDEYDSEENHIRQKRENEYIVEGFTKLEVIEQKLNVKFGETDFETINGYIVSKLDRIPKKGERTELQINGYNFKILKVEKNVIKTVLVTKILNEAVNDDASEDEKTVI